MRTYNLQQAQTICDNRVKKKIFRAPNILMLSIIIFSIDSLIDRGLTKKQYSDEAL